MRIHLCKSLGAAGKLHESNEPQKATRLARTIQPCKTGGCSLLQVADASPDPPPWPAENGNIFFFPLPVIRNSHQSPFLLPRIRKIMYAKQPKNPILWKRIYLHNSTTYSLRIQLVDSQTQKAYISFPQFFFTQSTCQLSVTLFFMLPLLFFSLLKTW